MHRALPIVSLVALLAAPAAWACDAGERLRLSDEIKRLQQKNVTAGVERKFNELEEIGCYADLTPEVLMAGGRAAQELGKTFEMFERFSAALEKEENAEAQQMVEGTLNFFGRVDIRGSARKRAALIREAMPYPPDQRNSIAYAQRVMEGRGSFRGMLPAGEYKVGEQVFTVEAGQEFQEILVGKYKPPKGDGGGDKGERVKVADAGLINWMGPVFMVGGGLWGSAEPKDQVYDDRNGTYSALPLVLGGTCGEDPATLQGAPSDRYVDPSPAPGDEYCIATSRQPGSIPMSTPIIDLTAGYEVGLTYTRPEVGVVALVNYKRTATRRFNELTFQLGAVVRPGIFRITAGPTWGFVFGRTDEYAKWTNEGQYGIDPTSEADRPRVPEIRGWAMGGGLAGSFGAALMQVGPFDGTVEAYGHWMRDDVRSYTGIGVRLGITPHVERFED